MRGRGRPAAPPCGFPPVEGRSGVSSNAARRRVAGTPHEDGLARARSRPDAFTEVVGPARAYLHGGFLGQCLVVVPESDVVAVRLLAWDAPKASEPESGFADFVPRVLALQGPG